MYISLHPKKIKLNEKNIKIVIEKIKNTIINYDIEILDLRFYKRVFLLKKNKFKREIEEIFDIQLLI